MTSLVSSGKLRRVSSTLNRWDKMRGSLLIFRNLEIERRRTTPYTTRDIIVGTMARAEPTTVITSLTNRHTTYRLPPPISQDETKRNDRVIAKRTQMGANPQHDEPLWFLDTVCVGLRVSQGLDLDGVGFLDFVGCSVADEDGLASPFDNDLLCLVCQFGAHWGGGCWGDVRSCPREWQRGRLRP